MNQNTPFPPSEFDDWSAHYDESVLDDRYPFTGYTQVLDECTRLAGVTAGMAALDLGTGTGNLAQRLAPTGCELLCTDFSNGMLQKARRKIPTAHFILHDLRQPFPLELNRRFERIVSAYVFHHFEPDEKVAILQRLRDQLLLPGGRLVIADISFADRQTLDLLRLAAGKRWDEEPYWIAADMIPALEASQLGVEYLQVSECAGIYKLEPR